MTEFQIIALIIAGALILIGLVRGVSGNTFIPSSFSVRHDHTAYGQKLRIEITHKVDDEILRLFRQLILKLQHRDGKRSVD